MCKLTGRQSVSLSLFKAADSNLQQDPDRGSNEIYKRMSSTVLCAVIVLTCTLTFSAAQTSCRGRCGTEFYRGFMCQCDYNCLVYDECCRDYESQCTTKDSCKGRCGETFKRGQKCSCDSDCMQFMQCCSDYKTNCDAEEPTPNEAGELPSTFSEGNYDEHLIPLSPTSYQQDDLGDDMYGQIFPNDESKGAEDQEKCPIPESTSGNGPPTADWLDQISAEPTQHPDTLEFSTEAFTAFSQTNSPDNETTQASDSLSTLHPTKGDTPAESTNAGDLTDSGTTYPQPTTAAHPAVSNQPTIASVNQIQNSPTTNIPELETVGQSGDDIFTEAQNTYPTVSSDMPEVTTTASFPPLPSISTEQTQSSSTVLENTQVTTIAPSSTLVSQSSSTVLENTQVTTIAPSSTLVSQSSSTVLENTEVTTIAPSSTLVSTPIPAATTVNPDTVINGEDVTSGPPLPDLEDPSISVSSAGSGNLSGLDAVTTHIPHTDSVPVGTTNDATQGRTTADPLNATPDPTKHTSSEATSKPQDTPVPYKPTPAKPPVAKPSSKPETKPVDTTPTLNTDSSREYQADDSNHTNLCNGRPVTAVTTLSNGTVVVFREHFFWLLDRNRVPGPAHSITQVWGVPSPIDTVFTRCSCQGKTYIFKGAQYWRFENAVLDPGYPKLIQTGFDGLRGQITAALSVPQYKTRRESVYFFKRGSLVQKYSYQFGSSRTCGRKVQYTLHTRRVRQTVSLLGPTVNIRTSWRGFPSTITAAVSIPSNREPEGYKYYVFSRSKSYNVRMDGERPVVNAPTVNVSPQSDVFKCPKRV